jgi:hypothetical protein
MGFSVSATSRAAFQKRAKPARFVCYLSRRKQRPNRSAFELRSLRLETISTLVRRAGQTRSTSSAARVRAALDMGKDPGVGRRCWPQQGPAVRTRSQHVVVAAKTPVSWV